MPVHHKLMIVPKAKGEKYGPIDGVRPQDYWITYNYLRYLRCCHTIESVYEHIENRRVKYCDSCYIDFQNANSINFVQIAHHTMAHERIAYIGQACLHCRKFIMRIKPAFECRDCIEEYLICNNRRIWESGHRTVVIQRWL